MAVSDKDKETTTSAASSEAGGTPHSAGGGTTITIPAIPSIPLNQVIDPKRLLWLGGLAAVGVLGVIEWPVVVAVGVGSYVAERFAKSNNRQA